MSLELLFLNRLYNLVMSAKIITWAILNAPYTAEEVKVDLFSIPGVKALGPDGFGSYFYKGSWHIVGDEVIANVLDVFQHGKLLKEANHTVVTLIPKTKCPKNVSDFRHISCCNTLYKCITKVLCGRLTQVLPDLLLENHARWICSWQVYYSQYNGGSGSCEALWEEGCQT